MISRVESGSIADWWWTVDRFILAVCLILMGLGILLSFAASPSVAQRIGIDDSFHFVKLHGKYAMVALLIMITLSFFSHRMLRHSCTLLLAICFFLLITVLLVGVEIKGAHRWLSLFGLTIQPSEFMKPTFTVVFSWLLAEKKQEKGGLPGYLYATGLYVFFSILLILEPDIGQTLLISITGIILFTLGGLSWFALFGLLGFAILLLSGTCFILDHVRERILRFMIGGGDTFQVDVGREAIINGGWFGLGPGEGVIKRIIPDSHSDFVFSVIAEEYGILLCLFMVMMFASIVLRSLYLAMHEQDLFSRLATSGLAVLFGLQSIVNMAVNLHLFPPKGITLPFISYGGSSLLASAFGMGCLLALTRRRPEKRMSLIFKKKLINNKLGCIL